MKKVSVIIPVYNVEKYIKRCIDSIINQTLKDIEIIIVNDGSKDNSIKIAKETTKNDKRVVLVEKENGGLSSARNEGLKHATGEYIYFIDSDDFIEKNTLEKTYNIAKKYDCDFVRFMYCRENLDLKTRKDFIEKNREGFYNKEEIVNSILGPMIGVLPDQINTDFINMSSCFNIYRRSIIKEKEIMFLSEKEYLSEDLIFNIDFLSNAEKGYVQNKVYYHYIKNNSSLTSSYRNDRVEKNVKLYNFLLEKLQNNNYCEDYKVRCDRAFINRIRECMKYELERTDISFTQKYKNVRNIIKNKTLRKVISDYPINKMNLFYKIIFTFIKLKFSFVLCLIYLITKKI